MYSQEMHSPTVPGVDKNTIAPPYCVAQQETDGVYRFGMIAGSSCNRFWFNPVL